MDGQPLRLVLVGRGPPAEPRGAAAVPELPRARPGRSGRAGRPAGRSRGSARPRRSGRPTSGRSAGRSRAGRPPRAGRGGQSRAANPSGSTHGPPTISKGRVVPRPSRGRGPLQEHGAGVDQRGVRVGMFGEGITQGSPVSPQSISRRQPPGGDDVELAAHAPLPREPAGQLPGRHPVAHGHRLQPHEGGPLGAQGVPLHRGAAQGVRAVEHHHPHAGLRRTPPWPGAGSTRRCRPGSPRPGGPPGGRRGRRASPPSACAASP